jgi:hypothetical protein
VTTASADQRELPALRITAVNSASQSTGSIHDDAKAREMGYRGGLVPGVEIMGYMSRIMMENYPSAWLGDSTFHGLLRRPVYEGDEVTVEGVALSPDDDGRVSVTIRVLDPGGNVCATARASCRAAQE